MNRHWVTAAVGAAARRGVAARGQLLVSVGFYVLVVGVMGSLWRSAAEGAGGSLAGYTGAQLFWYIAASEAGTVPLAFRMIAEIGDDIADGSVEVELLRPVPMLGLRVATALGTALPRAAVCLAAGVVFSLLVTGWWPGAAALVLTIPALILAMLCNVVAQHAFASLAFWVRDARSAWFLYQKLVFLLGGMLVPLELFPAWLESAARALPFAAMAYVPARTLTGLAEPWLPAVQLAWLAVLAALAHLGFTAGERRLQRIGA